MPGDALRQAAPAGPWLTVVGIGEDGVDGLGEEAKRHVAAAEFLFGGKRHLALVANLATGERRAWPSPFDTAMKAVLGLSGRRVCVLASGDPFMHGVGATLARSVDAGEMRVLPAPSAFSLMAARLGWALQDIETISLHGQPNELILSVLHPGRRILALTSDAAAPTAIARLLAANGFGPSLIHVGEALGGPDERLRAARADRFDLDEINPLNVLAIEAVSVPQARIVPLAGGRPDHLFDHDGQITKREVRAITLSSLAPRPGQLLWDIGAGSGSVAIEWMLAHRAMRALAVEANPVRAARIRANALSLGVPGLDIVEGMAPAALAGLPVPDAIFIGGGGSDDGVLDAAEHALASGGRLVVNAVTLELEAMLLLRQARLGGDLARISIARSAPVGTMQALRPAIAVTQWTWVKP